MPNAFISASPFLFVATIILMSTSILANDGNNCIETNFKSSDTTVNVKCVREQHDNILRCDTQLVEQKAQLDLIQKNVKACLLAKGFRPRGDGPNPSRSMALYGSKFFDTNYEEFEKKIGRGGQICFTNRCKSSSPDCLIASCGDRRL